VQYCYTFSKNHLRVKRNLSYLKIHFVPRVNTLGLAYENQSVTAVCSEIYIKHMNERCGHKVEFLSVKPDSTLRNH
jgi:hypothetical protein